MHDTVGRADYDANRTQQRGRKTQRRGRAGPGACLTRNHHAERDGNHPLVPDRSGDLDQRANGQHLCRQHGRDFQQATGPTDVVVSVPVGVSAQLLWTDPGFGYGETVTIVESSRLRVTASGVQIMISTYVPATGSLPVLVEVVPANAGVVTASAQGATNAQVRISTTV